MKSISTELKAHIALEVTTLCTCWKLTRRDEAGTIVQQLGFTDHVEPLEIDSLTYEASTGYTASAIQTSAALNVDNLEVESAFDSESITEEALLAGLWDFAELEIFQVNYADLTQGTLKLRKGNLGEVRIARNVFVAELRGMMQRLQQATGYLVMPACNADVGDDRCKVDLFPFTYVSTISSITSNSAFSSSAMSGLVADNFFNGGKMTFTSGANDGLSMEVKGYSASGDFVLQQPMPFDLNNGDEFSVYAGCNKSLAHCRDKFNNVVNRRAFDFLPGINRIASGS